MKTLHANILITANILALSTTIIAITLLNHFGIGNNTAWIGFLGSIIGGLLTFSGVVITILFTKKENSMILAKTNEPHLIVTEITEDYTNPNKDNIQIIFCPYYNNDNMDKKNMKYVKLSNIGIGTASNVSIRKHCGMDMCKNTAWNLPTPCITNSILPNQTIILHFYHSLVENEKDLYHGFEFLYEDITGKKLKPVELYMKIFNSKG